jgi:DNA-binding response OmpR family regulator
LSTRPKKALLVIKEPALAAGLAEILRLIGYEWDLIIAETDDATVAVQRAVKSNHYDVIIGQQRMSPYSGFNLLHDVLKAARTSFPAVVCLAENDSAHDTFIRQGGASYKTLQPGTISLLERVEEAVEDAREYRDQKKADKMTVLRRIASFTTERKFQEFVIDILRMLEYSGVCESSGPSENGRDILCWETNRMGNTEYIGIQVKLGDVHGGGGTSGLSELRRQAAEAFGIPAPFPDGHHHLDKFVIITAGGMTPNAREKLSSFAENDHIHRRIYFLDREELADLVVKSCPALLVGIE